MRLVKHLLELKGAAIYSIAPDEPVLDAIRMMADKYIGALLVMDNGQLVGIISERDYARKVILKGRLSDDTAVRDIMSTDMATTCSEDNVQHCMNLMTDKRIRHLPVIDDGRVTGIISIGDLVKAIIDDQQHEIEQLGQYISG